MSKHWHRLFSYTKMQLKEGKLIPHIFITRLCRKKVSYCTKRRNTSLVWKTAGYAYHHAWCFLHIHFAETTRSRSLRNCLFELGRRWRHCTSEVIPQDWRSIRVVDDNDTIRFLFQNRAWGFLLFTVTVPIPWGVQSAIVCPADATVQFLVLFFRTHHLDRSSFWFCLLFAFLTGSNSKHGTFVSTVIHHFWISWFLLFPFTRQKSLELKDNLNCVLTTASNINVDLYSCVEKVFTNSQQ